MMASSFSQPRDIIIELHSLKTGMNSFRYLELTSGRKSIELVFLQTDQHERYIQGENINFIG